MTVQEIIRSSEINDFLQAVIDTCEESEISRYIQQDERIELGNGVSLVLDYSMTAQIVAYDKPEYDYYGFCSYGGKYEIEEWVIEIDRAVLTDGAKLVVLTDKQRAMIGDAISYTNKKAA